MSVASITMIDSVEEFYLKSDEILKADEMRDYSNIQLSSKHGDAIREISELFESSNGFDALYADIRGRLEPVLSEQDRLHRAGGGFYGILTIAQILVESDLKADGLSFKEISNLTKSITQYNNRYNSNYSHHKIGNIDKGGYWYFLFLHCFTRVLVSQGKNNV